MVLVDNWRRRSGRSRGRSCNGCRRGHGSDIGGCFVVVVVLVVVVVVVVAKQTSSDAA